MLYYILMAGVFLSTVLLVTGMYRLLYTPRLMVLQRIEAHTSDAQLAELSGEAAMPPVKGQGLKRELLNFMGVLGAVLQRRTKLQAIQQKLIQAHILMRAEELIGFSLIAAVVVAVVFFLVLGQFLVALPLAVLAYFLPGLLVDIKKKRRMVALTGQLPEALDIISSGLRAGYSFPQAMAVVSREMETPIKEEFYRVIWENRMGKNLEEALHNLGNRTDSEDLDLFITALLIQKKVGGNLSEVLNNISHTIRERVRIKGEINTLTAQGKFSAIVVILLPIAVGTFIGLIDPDYIMLLFQHLLGLVMVVAAVVLMVIGAIIIRRIVDIDV